MVIIKVRKNGSLKVMGDDVKVVDWNGNEYPIVRRPIALCRCAASKTKPFCDGSHRAIGFRAAEAAAPEPNAGEPDALKPNAGQPSALEPEAPETKAPE